MDNFKTVERNIIVKFFHNFECSNKCEWNSKRKCTLFDYKRDNNSRSDKCVRLFGYYND